MKRKTAIKKLMTEVDRNTANLILDLSHDLEEMSNEDIVNEYKMGSEELEKRLGYKV